MPFAVKRQPKSLLMLKYRFLAIQGCFVICFCQTIPPSPKNMTLALCRSDITTIDVFMPTFAFLEKMASCRLILSSSLWDRIKAVFSLNIENNTGFLLVASAKKNPEMRGSGKYRIKPCYKGVLTVLLYYLYHLHNYCFRKADYFKC